MKKFVLIVMCILYPTVCYSYNNERQILIQGQIEHDVKYLQHYPDTSKNYDVVFKQYMFLCDYLVDNYHDGWCHILNINSIYYKIGKRRYKN